jgi:hypothetical protein
MGAAEPQGEHRHRLAALAPPPPTAKQPSNPNSQQPQGKRPKGSSTKKGAWGEGTAGAEAEAGAEDGRAVAVPEGGAAVVRIEEPGAAAQHPPVHLGSAEGI